MIAVDEHGVPVPVQPLEPQTEEEGNRYKAAQLHRELRQEMERRHLLIKEG